METNPRFTTVVHSPAEGIYNLGGTWWLRVYKPNASYEDYNVDEIITNKDEPVFYRYIETPYVPEILKKLTPDHRVSVEEMSEFGHTHHSCVWCGSKITASSSHELKEIGYHEWCASRMDVPRKPAWM